jgi:hypothetical protein
MSNLSRIILLPPKNICSFPESSPEFNLPKNAATDYNSKNISLKYKKFIGNSHKEINF